MTRTHTGPPSTDWLSKQRFYRRLLVGFVAGGVGLSLALRELLGYPLVGEAVYWLGIVGFLAVWRGTPVTLFDERDLALERRASQLTLTAFAVVLVLGASAGRVVPRVTTYGVPDWVWPALNAYASVFVVFAGVYLYLRARR